MIKIVPLYKIPDYTPILAFWSYMEWHINKGVNFDILLKSYKLRINKDKLPIAFVATYKTLPVGMISLKENDLWARKDLAPWLSSLYVIPQFRYKNIATRLINRVVEKSKKLGYDRIFLFLAQSDYIDLNMFYTKRGWIFFDHEKDNSGLYTKILVFKNL